MVSCKKDPIPIQPDQYYLHLSHTRTDSNPQMDSVVEQIDYSNFDMLWLGGDLAYLTSDDDETLSNVNSILDLGNQNTLWSLGNHDYTNMNLIRDYTQRPAYYSYFKNKITFVVLDTQDSISNIVGNQKNMVYSVMDTIQESTRLVLLHHKLIWMYDNPILEPQIPVISNASLGDCFYCINPNNFYIDIYPRLVETHNKGIEVICIGGDIGFNANEFEYITPEGIIFLASGIKWGDPQNKALLFHHDLNLNSLTWEYKLTTDLE